MKFKAVFFDCDGVLTNDGWRKLDMFAISKKIWLTLVAKHNRGELTIEDWIKESISHYRKKGVTRESLTKLYADAEINPDAPALFKFLHTSGVKTAIISSGFKTYVEIIAKKLHVSDYYYNSILVFDKKGRLTDIKKRNYDQEQDKVDRINEYCVQERIDPQETMFVGDSLNDRGAFKYTRHGLLLKSFHDDTELKKYAWKSIKRLNEIKELIT